MRKLISILCCIYISSVTLAGDSSSACAEGVMTLNQPSLTRNIDLMSAKAQQKKFVQVDIENVDNPHLIPIAFTVYYISTQGGKIYLGSFSLYPPDNPGRFIVATQRKLTNEGTISVSMVPLETFAEHQKIRVKIRSISLVDTIK